MSIISCTGLPLAADLAALEGNQLDEQERAMLAAAMKQHQLAAHAGTTLSKNDLRAVAASATASMRSANA